MLRVMMFPLALAADFTIDDKLLLGYRYCCDIQVEILVRIYILKAHFH
jgi:hypothetical protein